MAPLATLVVLLGGPLVCLLLRPAGLVAVVLAVGGLTAALTSDPLASVLAGLALAGLAGVVLRLLAGRGVPRGWLVLSWIACMNLPVWLPACAGRLASGRAGAGPPGWSWALWPPAALAGETWDPLRLPPLYESWGARTGTAEAGLAVWLAALALAAAALYFLPGGPIRRREDPDARR